MFGDYVSHRTLFCSKQYTLLPSTSMPNFGAMADINSGLHHCGQNPFNGTGAALLPAGKFLENCAFRLARNRCTQMMMTIAGHTLGDFWQIEVQPNCRIPQPKECARPSANRTPAKGNI